MEVLPIYKAAANAYKTADGEIDWDKLTEFVNQQMINNISNLGYAVVDKKLIEEVLSLIESKWECTCEIANRGAGRCKTCGEWMDRQENIKSKFEGLLK